MSSQGPTSGGDITPAATSNQGPMSSGDVTPASRTTADTKPPEQTSTAPHPAARSASELSRELGRIERRLDTMRSHPQMNGMLDAVDAADAAIRAGDLKRATEIIDGLNQYLGIAESLVAEGGLEVHYGDADPNRFVEYSPTSPSGKGTPVELDATSPLANDPVGQRLLGHVEDAIARFEIEGYTEPQLAAQRRLELEGKTVQARNLAAAQRGSRIDEFTKEAVLRDPELQHVYITVNFERGADFLDSQTGRWYDITTTKGWKEHLRKYGNSTNLPAPKRLPTEPQPTTPGSGGN